MAKRNRRKRNRRITGNWQARSPKNRYIEVVEKYWDEDEEDGVYEVFETSTHQHGRQYEITHYAYMWIGKELL